jgi:Ca2+-binding EF-hand superfamily protein
MGNCVGGKGKKDPTILTEEEIKLLLENTKLNRAQINALHQNFLRECPSGKLTKKDFVKLFKEVHPSENKKEKADKFCEYVFKVIDRDSLGYISFNDFVLCFSLTSYGDFKQKCEFAFRLYDLDKDNKISKKEMTQVLVALYDLSGITDRKKDKAPAKKVAEIMKVINTKTDEQEAAAQALEAPVEQPTEDKKKPKKAKKPKARDFITREQFIDACSNDDALKKLFVDSIFAATSEQPSELEAEINRVSATTSGLPEGCSPRSTVQVSDCVNMNSICLDAPAPTYEVTTSSNVEFVSLDTTPIVEETVLEKVADLVQAVVDPEPTKHEEKEEIVAVVAEEPVAERSSETHQTFTSSEESSSFTENQLVTSSVNVRLSKSKRN